MNKYFLKAAKKLHSSSHRNLEGCCDILGAVSYEPGWSEYRDIIIHFKTLFNEYRRCYYFGSVDLPHCELPKEEQNEVKEQRIYALLLAGVSYNK